MRRYRLYQRKLQCGMKRRFGGGSGKRLAKNPREPSWKLTSILTDIIPVGRHRARVPRLFVVRFLALGFFLASPRTSELRPDRPGEICKSAMAGIRATGVTGSFDLLVRSHVWLRRSGYTSRTRPKEAEAERGRTKGDY
jgi:hypothetical protein